MDRAVFLQCGADALDVEADEMSDFYVGDFPLSLHLAEPAE